MREPVSAGRKSTGNCLKTLTELCGVCNSLKRHAFRKPLKCDDGANQQGIVVCGEGANGQYYVLADRTVSLSPRGWAQVSIDAYREFGADRIVAERNFGGDMVESTIRAVDYNVPVKLVTASRGKAQRAEPIAALYEQGRVHHVGVLKELEDQLTTWTPTSGISPDRLDALVWALTELTRGVSAAAWIEYLKEQNQSVEQAEPVDRESQRQAAFEAGLKQVGKNNGYSG
jgi:hypothetical protein